MAVNGLGGGDLQKMMKLTAGAGGQGQSAAQTTQDAAAIPSEVAKMMQVFMAALQGGGNTGATEETQVSNTAGKGGGTGAGNIQAMLQQVDQLTGGGDTATKAKQPQQLNLMG